MIRSAVCRLFAAALLAALGPAVLRAAPAGPAAADDAPSAAEKVRKALDAPVSVKVEKQSLTAAIDMLKEKGKVNLVLDTFSIQQMGIAPDQPPTPVDVDLKDVKLKSALHTVLSPYGLSYAVVGDTVIVTTEQMAVVRQMRQRVNVEFDKVEFAQALKRLGRETGANLLLDSRLEKEAKVPVSLELEDVPLETAVRLLSEMAGVKPVRIGNVLFITDKKNAAELRQDPDLSGPPVGPPVLPEGDKRLEILTNLGAAAPAVGPPPNAPKDHGPKEEDQPKPDAPVEKKEDK